MDDPALLKAVFLNQPLHRRIVGVGIDADIGGNAFAMIGGALEQPVDPPVAGQPMDRDVGLVVQLFALLNVRVGRLRAIKQGKYSVYAGLIVYHLADPFLKVGPDQVRARIKVSSLGGISRPDHVVLRVFVYSPDLSEISFCRISQAEHIVSSTFIRFSGFSASAQLIAVLDLLVRCDQHDAALAVCAEDKDLRHEYPAS